MKTQIILSEKEVESIIREHLTTRFKELKVSSVKLVVENQLRGNQMNEYYAAVFKGATCEVDM